MARSLSGGTRGFLRGKIASDMYQVTKDARGRKIQLVSAYAPTRINNRTVAQSIARMQMAACMGCLAQFKDIVDHSFQGIPFGQLSIANFVKLNIPLLQRDTAQHWDAGAHFDYPGKGESSILAGEWILATGNLSLPEAVSLSKPNEFSPNFQIVIDCGKVNASFADLRSALGIAFGDYFTLVSFASSFGTTLRKFCYRRYYLSDALQDSDALTAESVGLAFTYDGNCDFSVSIDISKRYIYLISRYTVNGLDIPQSLAAVIISRWSGKVWQRNNAVFAPAPNDPDPYADYHSPADVFSSWCPSWDGTNPYE